jgi:rRNA maturation RNase YbeY
MANTIKFFTEDTSFQTKHKTILRLWLSKLLQTEGVSRFTVNIILCSDKYLRKLNKEYLGHDYFTDVVSFNYNETDCLTGDVFISIDRVRENAKQFEVSMYHELYRVMAHGTLHLAGYDDATTTLRADMKKKEDYYISLLLIQLNRPTKPGNNAITSKK